MKSMSTVSRHARKVDSAPTIPHISVVIPTYNRPLDIRRCLDSLAHVRHPHWDVMVVDQSDDNQTQTIVESVREAVPHLIYRRLSDKGAARARNYGLQAASGDIIAFLDDDCTVAADWLPRIAAVFRRYPQAALVFGALDAAPHNRQDYYIPAYRTRRERIARGLRGFMHTEGVGASMYVRRVAVSSVGLFDVCLGPGSSLFVYGGEEVDYLYRCFLHGLTAVYTPHIAVKHHGAREYKSGAVERIFRGYAFSGAGADMKLLRCGYPVALVLIASHSLYCLTRVNIRNVLSRRGPTNYQWITMYVRGLRASFRLSVDRTTCAYVPETDDCNKGNTGG